ncbi:helix-turn-helix domain-containing protein [Streptomyces lavendulocolor]|uniref:helix-turn-helix domain-containing protein n=1 Tax=Streptomyces lavendulocolor TaxID=67316 RepID=UPI003C2DF7C3
MPFIRRATGAGAVLGAVLDHGPVARSTVARLTGLSPATVSGHSHALVRRGLLREDHPAPGPRGPGRPHVPVDVDTGRHLVAGAHIAVAHTTLSLMDLRGRIVAEDRRPHRGTDPGSVLDGLAARLPGLLAAHGAGRTVLALGAATGHWVDPGVADDHPRVRFVDEVVPLLQERGLFRTEYTGTTLRDHYGLRRPANRIFDTVEPGTGQPAIGLVETG